MQEAEYNPAESLLIALIAGEICQRPVPTEILQQITPAVMEKLAVLAQYHDLGHVVAQALEKRGCLGEDAASTRLKALPMKAVSRYVRLNFAYQQMAQVLSEKRIAYLPLKGTVLRNAYPAPWMRTSCDIDLLVKPEDLALAVATLTETLSYTYGKKSEHDISLYTPEGVHLELHFDTIPQRYTKAETRQVLERIWDYAQPETPESCCYYLSDAAFYFYHVAHMAQHFENGGCGIRSFLDLWILNHWMPENRQQRQALLQAGGLAAFAAGAERLSEHWFSGATLPDALLFMRTYILWGGTHGARDNRAALGQAKKGGRGKYLLGRIFVSYDHLKAEYPILEKQKWLFLFCQVVRWLRMLFVTGLGRTVRELQANANVDTEEKAEIQRLLTYLEI